MKNPHIVTLLYRGGTILASRKTSYADILKADRLEQVVEELMKEQHREMLRRLKNGEFDGVIAGRRPGAGPVAAPAAVAPAPELPTPASPEPKSAAEPQQQPAAKPRPAPGASREERAALLDASLDEIILSYLMGEEEEKKKP